ncbi:MULTISPECIES: MarR family winged helix-turn-helix transcriptional regulator [Cupriavidus]|uniref:DNA-binding MarR family transcriptional regulator n=1 Tax=Cupriavidus alkaliphilus TaxID=942866 RepID=A0A7W4VGQ6_9BURK|nr:MULTISPECIES: MarR family transcriptional regulator [Cupriavidus]MBB3011287.1 DNA-binding MarR family transcriptional regulator [Cupriavidus alkaliphilus]
MTGIYDDALRPVGLKITQLSLLRALDRLGAATYKEIAAEVALDKTTISRNIKLLIDSGWVTISGEEDARYKVAKLSPSGIRMLRDAEPHWRNAQTQVEREMKKFLKGPAKAALLEALETLQQVGSERRG